MEKKDEILVLLLPGDTLTMTTDHAVKLYYRTEDIDLADRHLKIEL